ncbi:Protein F37C4,5 [Caenorhabditis elegans] [Rhizoctonia solani]|uniref:Protein F37C4,5 [Caenorhabditis elegans] n=1 Tax=Rhizoctonia solani TaxID=456999 RepID=A0A0K6FNH3_9AGAM|nr:Protein F37C4,5 [Caenorhabditis elegans] [Rhizoctonia solani]
MVSEHPVANRIVINAAEQDDLIESVTVFQSNRAEVKRRVNLDLKNGQNHIRIERLPSGINEDSIRVDGTGTAVIFDVVYHAPSHDQTRSSTATTNLRRALEGLQKERSIAQQQSEFLGNYGQTLDSKSTNIEDVQRFLDMFGPRQLAVARRIQELDTRIDEAREELNEVQRKEFEDARGAQRGTAVTVTVLAEADGPVELMLTYVVLNASWTPLYDVRASIAKTPKETSTIALHYRASITQTTGENWSDVALTLSTASPQLGSSVPKLSSWRVGIPAPVATPPWRSRTAFVPTAPVYSPKSPCYSPTSPCYSPCGAEPHAVSRGYPPPTMTIRQARVESVGVLNTTFGIPGRSEIPSDEGNHKVVIAVLELQADLEWICVPREKESVFLTCKVVNSSDFTLLPGDASVFMDDNFVSKTQIEHVSPNESFKTSLGVDSALRVTYPTAKSLKRTAAQAGFAFMAKEKRSVSAQSQRITIRNSRKAPVSVGILDHLPVSTDARLKVDVIAPKELDVAAAPTSSNEGVDENGTKERPWKIIRKGLKTRWAPLELGGEGTVEWSCDIDPSDEAELELAWEVSAPEGQKWVFES